MLKLILSKFNLCSDIHYSHYLKILKNFLDTNKDLAKQGSDEWLDIRKYTIGGSEISVITGDNPYSKLDDLISQKVGFSKFTGNIACRWGKIFEFVTIQITEKIMNIDKIYDTGSLEGAIEGQRYSPDGLAVVKIKCSDTINNELLESNEYCIVLFEFKSPYSSVPTGIIPNHYLPQVLTGLCSIPICDFAIFINNVYRKCSISDLDTTLIYDNNFHSRDKKLEPTEVLALGINIFYQTNEQKNKFMKKYINELNNKTNITNSYYTESESESETESDSAQNIFNNINKQNITTYSSIPYLYRFIERKIKLIEKHSIDFGESHYYEFNDLLTLYDEDLISLHVCKPHICEDYYKNDFLKTQELKPNILDNKQNSIESYKREINEFPNIIGFLPWKLFKSDIIIQERDPEYLNKHKDSINNALNILKNISSSKTEFEKIKKFKQYFPNSKILNNNGFDTHNAFSFLPTGI